MRFLIFIYLWCYNICWLWCNYINGFLRAFVGEVFNLCLIGVNNFYKCFGIVVNLSHNKMTISNLSIGALLFKPSNRVLEGGKIIGLSRLADYWLD